MNHEEKFSVYKLWLERCQQLGLKGPYKLTGAFAGMQQFTKEFGTAAIWNPTANTPGIIFAAP